MSGDDDCSLVGRCYCGQVTWAYPIAAHTAAYSLYCHCQSCRRAHAAPLYQVSYVDAAPFGYVRGGELVRDAPSASNRLLNRQFASCCGTRTVNRFVVPADAQLTHPFFRAGASYVGIFAGSLDNDPLPPLLTATRHLWCEESILQPGMLADPLPHHRQGSTSALLAS